MSGFWRCAAYLLALALLAHPLGQWLPSRFQPERFPFRAWKWEKGGRVYAKLHIDGWKKLVPDMSRVLPDMVRKELPAGGAVTAEQAERLVQEHPEINVLVGFNEPLAVGVAEAVDELGVTGQVRAISFDTNMRCVELMQTGAVTALIVQNPYAMGYLGVEKAWQALQGEKFNADELIDTATQIVTRDNMFTLESQKALFSFN